MSVEVLAALGLFFVLEGIMPFVAPGVWRDTFRRISELRDGQIRFMGMLSVALGVLLFWFAVG